jgi:hypothetical protein
MELVSMFRVEAGNGHSPYWIKERPQTSAADEKTRDCQCVLRSGWKQVRWGTFVDHRRDNISFNSLLAMIETSASTHLRLVPAVL